MKNELKVVKFNIGDKVEVIDKSLKTYGLIGNIVSNVHEFLGQEYCHVEFIIHNKKKKLKFNVKNLKQNITEIA